MNNAVFKAKSNNPVFPALSTIELPRKSKTEKRPETIQRNFHKASKYQVSFLGVIISCSHTF
jgi:hypothetical protein